MAQSIIVGLQGFSPESGEYALVSTEGLGGVILFKRNVQSAQQVWRLNRDLARAAVGAGQPPLFIMVDQEGGTVYRLPDPFIHGPDFCVLGDLSPQALHDHGFALGRQLTAAGFNWNLAPVMDVHGFSQGIMARRSLGADPDRVGELGVAFALGQQTAGCLAAAKHFPGLGRTTLDTHRHKPVVNLKLPDLRAMELKPFAAAIKAKVAGIMVCHAVFTALDPHNPASLSFLVMDKWLRRELGYEGLILTDDLEMGALRLEPALAAVAAYKAGADLLLICSQTEAAWRALDLLEEQFAAGHISAERINAGYERIMRVKAQLAAPFPSWAQLQKILDRKT